jgi:hypothetical protein
LKINLGLPKNSLSRVYGGFGQSRPQGNNFAGAKLFSACEVQNVFSTTYGVSKQVKEETLFAGAIDLHGQPRVKAGWSQPLAERARS